MDKINMIAIMSLSLLFGVLIGFYGGYEHAKGKTCHEQFEVTMAECPQGDGEVGLVLFHPPGDSTEDIAVKSVTINWREKAVDDVIRH